MAHLKAVLWLQIKIDSNKAIQKAKDFSGLKNMDLAKVVSTPKTYSFNQGSFDIFNILLLTRHLQNLKWQFMIMELRKNIFKNAC